MTDHYPVVTYLPAGTSLAAAIAAEISGGARVNSQTQTGAVLRTWEQRAWPIYLLLSILTGVFVFVWIALSITARAKRRIITLEVQRDGSIRRTEDKW